MGWQDLTHSDENAKYHCYRFARLVIDDTGQELGLVMQFCEWGPAYALLHDCRLGPYDTFEQAKIEEGQTATLFSQQANLKTSRGPLRAVRPRQGSAGHCRERRINESGIEQTVVAFDVTLQVSDISAGSGGLLATP